MTSLVWTTDEDVSCKEDIGPAGGGYEARGTLKRQGRKDREENRERKGSEIGTATFEL